MSRLARALTAALFLIAVAAGPVTAQDDGPLAGLVVAGYGTVTYGAALDGPFPNDFTASISPVLLYGMGQDFLFEAELEFGLSGDQTTTTLEYAQIDYLGFEKIQVIAGKFLLPFGLFGERLHPSWINKLPTSPVLFGHAHGGVAEGSLLPILSDAGAMVRLNQPLGARWGLDLSVWISQGPRLITEDLGEGGDDHAHDATTPFTVRAADASAASAQAAYSVPTVGFGVSFTDNNKNKMFGARLGLVSAPGFEVYVSGFHAMYDPDDFLDYQGLALSAEWRTGPYAFRGEGAYLRQEFQHETTFEFLETPAYYVEASRRISDFEPVIRWNHMLEGEVSSATVTAERQSLDLGLIYWVGASVPLKVSWQWDPDLTDRVFVQWAFGF